jgi:hypothetical protein
VLIIKACEWSLVIQGTGGMKVMAEGTRISTIQNDNRSLTFYFDPETKELHYVVKHGGSIIYTGDSYKKAKDIFDQGQEPRSI